MNRKLMIKITIVYFGIVVLFLLRQLLYFIGQDLGFDSVYFLVIISAIFVIIGLIISIRLHTVIPTIVALQSSACAFAITMMIFYFNPTITQYGTFLDTILLIYRWFHIALLVVILGYCLRMLIKNIEDSSWMNSKFLILAGIIAVLTNPNFLFVMDFDRQLGMTLIQGIAWIALESPIIIFPILWFLKHTSKLKTVVFVAICGIFYLSILLILVIF